MKSPLSSLGILFGIVISSFTVHAQDKPKSLYRRFMDGKLMQSNFVQQFISSEKDTSRHTSFLVLPALGYAQETGLEYGLSGVVNYKMDRSDSLIRTSSLLLMGTLTEKGQSYLKLQSDLWTKGNTYHVLSLIRWRNFPFNFYGVGGDTHKADEQLITQKLFSFNVLGERKIAPQYYAGLTFRYQQYDYVNNGSPGIFESGNFYGRDGGKLMAVGISQTFDNRNSNVYTTRGYQLQAIYSYAPDFFGGDNFTGSELSLNLKAFYPVFPKVTLGIQLTYDELFGNIPFYLYPQLGNDEVMRGYYQGRFRDKTLFTSQAELRYRFVNRFAIVAFGGAGTVYSSKFVLSGLKPSFGGGIRYFFDINHNSSVRIDYAVGEKRAGEPRQSGVYLSLGEAF
ncbi:BamA/TamA family outer membrane protein [Olivibacter sitiensis]|uniref:BamA/TamA family outer membrane protein n=1 Tax=Olivibacter sitiensis TaxID=376470 RepID=UPI00041585D4|nr:BamA/TamA family outer membrane protein [Olivibacter sitiensis]